MLKLAEPLKLKLNTVMTTTSDAFSQRINSNYQIMNMTINREEFLHFIMNPPEMYYVEGGTTMLIEENQIVNNQKLNMNLIYQMFNRLVVNADYDYKYQDKVFIEAVLRKIGVSNIAMFMKQIQNIKSNQQTEKKLYQLYEQQMITESNYYQEIKNQTINLLNEEENYLAYNTHKYSLQDSIYNRLDTKKMYEILYQYNFNDFREEDYHSSQAFQFVEEMQVAKQIQLNEWKSYVLPSAFISYYPQNNVFEEGAMVSHADIKEVTYSNLVSSIATNIIKQMHFMNVNYFDETHSFKQGYYLQEIARNTFQRFEKMRYVTQKSQNTYIENFKKKEELYAKEIEFIEEILHSNIVEKKLITPMLEEPFNDENKKMTIQEYTQYLSFFDIKQLYSDHMKLESLHYNYPPLYMRLNELVEQEIIQEERPTSDELELKELLMNIIYSYEEEHILSAIQTLVNDRQTTKIQLEMAERKEIAQIQLYIKEEFEKSKAYLSWINTKLQEAKVDTEEETINLTVKNNFEYTKELWDRLTPLEINTYINQNGYEQYFMSNHQHLYELLQTNLMEEGNQILYEEHQIKEMIYDILVLIERNNLTKNSIVSQDNNFQNLTKLHSEILENLDARIQNTSTFGQYMEKINTYFNMEEQYYLTYIKNKEEQLNVDTLISPEYYDVKEWNTTLQEEIGQLFDSHKLEQIIENKEIRNKMLLYSEEEWTNLTIENISKEFQNNELWHVMGREAFFSNHVVEYLNQKQDVENNPGILIIKHKLHDLYKLIQYNQVLQDVEYKQFEFLYQEIREEHMNHKEQAFDFSQDVVDRQVDLAYTLWNTQYVYQEDFNEFAVWKEESIIYENIASNILKENATYQEVIRDFEMTPRVIYRLYDNTYIEGLEDKINSEIGERKIQEMKKQQQEIQEKEKNVTMTQSVQLDYKNIEIRDEKMIERVVQSNLQRELSMITKHVYSQIEKKMDNERKRRGY